MLLNILPMMPTIQLAWIHMLHLWLLQRRRCRHGWWTDKWWWSKWWLQHVSNITAGSTWSTVSECIRWQFGVNDDWRKHFCTPMILISQLSFVCYMWKVCNFLTFILFVHCHYFLPGLQLPPQPLRGLLPVLLPAWVWTVCPRLLPNSVAAVIWTHALLHLSPAC